MNVAYSERRRVALFIQHAMLMCPILLSSVACSTLHFYTLSDKRNDLKIVVDKKFVFWSPRLLSQTIFILVVNEQYMIINMFWSLHKVSFLSYFNKTLIFWEILKKYSSTKFIEYPSNGSRVVSCGRTHKQDGRIYIHTYIRTERAMRKVFFFAIFQTPWNL
jgi:hypothetical protein